MATQEIITKETIETTTTTTIRTIEDVIMPPELVIIDKQVYCTSLQIAEHFEKRHDNVLQDIENAIRQVQAANNPDMPAAQMFVKGFDEAPNNLGFKVKRPMYHLNVDGFSFLCLGYTGDKAAKFKLTYMAAFKKMRELLLNLMESPKTISSDQIRHLTGQISLIAGWFHMNNASHWLNNLLRFHLNTNSINDIRAEDYPKAQALIENARRQGEEYLQMRIDIEKEILLDYLCQGIPFTATLRKKYQKQFKAKLPSYPNWKEIALQLELKAA